MLFRKSATQKAECRGRVLGTRAEDVWSASLKVGAAPDLHSELGVIRHEAWRWAEHRDAAELAAFRAGWGRVWHPGPCPV